MVDEPATHHLPSRKDYIGESWTLVPSKEDGTPLRFQTYFNLPVNSLAHNLIKESVKLHKELHHIRELLRQAKTKPYRIKKDGAPKGRATITYRGGVPTSRDAPVPGTKRFRVKGKLAPRYIDPFKIIDRQGEVAYKIELPSEIPDVHKNFQVSQLRKCLQVPNHPDLYKDIDHQAIDLQPDFTYRDRPFSILDEAQHCTRSRTIKYFKVQWKNHTEAEATSEHQDYFRSEFPYLFSS
ncbi:hypothetical protein ZWY2020_020302 [Hordeum vulgare]|nr:hypothetical protein ZWY2020_020302 [Hordeum vulgare]